MEHPLLPFLFSLTQHLQIQALTASNELLRNLQRRHPHLQHTSPQGDGRQDPQEEPCLMATEEDLLSLHLEVPCLKKNDKS